MRLRPRTLLAVAALAATVALGGCVAYPSYGYGYGYGYPYGYAYAPAPTFAFGFGGWGGHEGWHDHDWHH